MELTEEELNLARQWFNAIYDQNSKYLEQPDHDLAVKIRDRLLAIGYGDPTNEVEK